MLVLTRKTEESIKIGNHITVTVLEIRGHQVKLGIEAPRETAVNRSEIYESIIQENIKASRVPPDFDQFQETLKLK